MTLPFRSSASRSPAERASRRPAALTWIHLGRAYLIVDRLIEQRVRPLGLTSPQFGLLNQLSRSHGPTQQDCSHALYVDKANLSGIVDRLERTGLVARIPDPTDRRYNRIYLTPRGREVLAAARADVEALLRRIFGALTTEEQERLHSLLGRLHRALE